jgi:hypothetical protein
VWYIKNNSKYRAIFSSEEYFLNKTIFIRMSFLILLIPFFVNCNLLNEDEEEKKEGPKNSYLAGTSWRIDRWRNFNGEADEYDEQFKANNKIIINDNNVTLSGSFWGQYQGTYPSYFTESSPDFTIPTAPRIIVHVTNSTGFELVLSVDEIWVREEKNSTLYDYYFTEYR